jgi:hypothetical protein
MQYYYVAVVIRRWRVGRRIVLWTINEEDAESWQAFQDEHEIGVGYDDWDTSTSRLDDNGVTPNSGIRLLLERRFRSLSIMDH